MCEQGTDSGQARILIVDDVPANLKLLQDILEPQGYRIHGAANGMTALKIAARIVPDMILLDIKMPGMDGFEVYRQLLQDPATSHIPVIFVMASDDEQSKVQGLQLGAVDYITKPFLDREVLLRVRNHLKIAQLTRTLGQKNRELEEEIARHKQTQQARQQADEAWHRADDQLSVISQQEAQRWGIEGFVGKSQAVRKIIDDVRKLQKAGTTSVLITGESGTGKELIARAIHYGSACAKGPFIAVNCTAIPGELAEAMLFGYAKGAFTGADESRKGYFERADGGTLFLDEIGDMPTGLQPKLLRVVEDGWITPVGSVRERHAKVRILAATNQDLMTKIATGSFREDLYFRLARFIVTVTPLRHRRDDIALLIEHFLTVLAADMGMHKPILSPQAREALESYRFPGNVRELKNIIERGLIESGGSVIRPHHLQLIGTSDIQIMPPETPIVGIEAGKGPSDFERRKELVVKRAQGQSRDNRNQNEQPGQTSDEERILAYAKEHDSIGNSECQDLLSVDVHRCSRLLKKLNEYGLLEREGERRWARYRLPLRPS